MPFISIQSIYTRVVTAITEFTSRLVTNRTQYYQGDQNGMPIISGDGQWMVTGSGPSPVQQFYPRVIVWNRSGGANLRGKCFFGISIWTWGVLGE